APGTYTINSTLNISKSGTADSKIYLLCSENGRALLDCSPLPFSSSNRGINLKANYWYIKGLDIKGAGDNGMNISGSNNIIEFCSFYENQDTGLQLSGGASNNRIINCDSYYNADPTNGNADGFAPKLDVGSNNYFYGCRAWQNSDDGWDGYLRPSDNINTIIENCWSFMNGYLKSGTLSSGNGNGFKMGGGDNTNKDSLRNNVTIKNSLCFDNRVKGFDQNNNYGSMILLNCTAFRNGSHNYAIPRKVRTTSEVNVKNCISYLSLGVNLTANTVQATNSWNLPIILSDKDFLSLDTTGVRGTRKNDGSLPDLKFLRPSKNSQLIDKGTDVGIIYRGSAPDLGAFEFDEFYTSAIKDELPSAFILEQNYPNPFNPTTTIIFKLQTASRVTLKVYDVLGGEAATLVDEYRQAGTYNSQFSILNSQLTTGVYFYRLTADNFTQTKKMVFLK
ncbi:MAG: T9SS type A sorting domain-containing protein, partial [Bacteroidota bacterium]